MHARHATTNKQLYRQLCMDEPTLPLFSRDWWLDATAGKDNWDVAVVKKHGVAVASMPYAVRRKLCLSISTPPMLTYFLGPWMRQHDAKHSTRLSRQKESMENLIGQLPRFDHFKQHWHHSQTNWLPFYWNGLYQTTDYTYVLPLSPHHHNTWQGLQENIRREVRKAGGRSGLRVRVDLPVSDFVPLHRQVFERQNKRLPYTKAYIDALDKACAERNCRKIFLAQDDRGALHAGVYLVWDENCAYYLMGGGDPGLRNSGAMSLCMWEAIKFASSVTKRFDFCGSMIEPVERFMRAFGGIQTPYFTVSRTPSRLAATLLFARSFMPLQGMR